jgi:hypothetical protein
MLLVWLYASLSYTHVASVVIWWLAMMPVWLYTHDACVVICERYLNANENDSHSNRLTYTHDACVVICAHLIPMMPVWLYVSERPHPC